MPPGHPGGVKSDWQKSVRLSGHRRHHHHLRHRQHSAWRRCSEDRCSSCNAGWYHGYRESFSHARVPGPRTRRCNPISPARNADPGKRTRWRWSFPSRPLPGTQWKRLQIVSISPTSKSPSSGFCETVMARMPLSTTRDGRRFGARLSKIPACRDEPDARQRRRRPHRRATRSPRPRRAPQRLRRLAEGADEGAAHPFRIAEAGGFGDAFDRLARRLHALPRHLDPQPLYRL
jgi:hypothetical protein